MFFRIFAIDYYFQEVNKPTVSSPYYTNILNTMTKMLPYSDHVADLFCSCLQISNPTHRNLVINHLSIRCYKPKETIYHEGDLPLNLFFMIEGKAKIFRENAKHDRILRMLAPLEFFGYPPYFTSSRFYVSVICVESSIVAAIPLSVMKELIEKEPQVSQYFLRQFAILLSISDQRGEVIARMNLRARLSMGLLYLSYKFGMEEDGQTLNVRLTREELGDLTNMNTSNAIRTLSQFASEGLIKTQGRRILLIDKDRLMNEIEDPGLLLESVQIGKY
ncbi:MAG: Crp/Fnr family transcriptional regulator [Prevotella sp.]|nr:Crp/Fnr family transcriptional regulator [Prevotella sp.]